MRYPRLVPDMNAPNFDKLVVPKTTKQTTQTNIDNKKKKQKTTKKKKCMIIYQ